MYNIYIYLNTSRKTVYPYKLIMRPYVTINHMEVIIKVRVYNNRLLTKQTCVFNRKDNLLSDMIK